jgi:hypothetical protein
MSDVKTTRVPVSRAHRWTWGLVAVALAFAGWHGYGVTVAPERPFFWIGVALDVLVAVNLYVEISTGCVTREAVPGLRDDLTKLAAALGAR